LIVADHIGGAAHHFISDIGIAFFDEPLAVEQPRPLPLHLRQFHLLHPDLALIIAELEQAVGAKQRVAGEHRDDQQRHRGACGGADQQMGRVRTRHGFTESPKCPRIKLHHAQAAVSSAYVPGRAAQSPPLPPIGQGSGFSRLYCE
jgi:hypothetical protein